MDSLKKYWKFIALLLIALAVALGLFQRKLDPYLGQSRNEFYSQNSVAQAPGMPDNGQDELSYYYKKAANLAGKDQNESTAAFLAAGDIMLSRGVAAAIYKANDYNLPYGKMADVLKSTDFNFANLENPFYPPPGPCGTWGAAGVIGGHSMVFGAPCDLVHGLAENNFKILDLANNHALDQGVKGLEFTQSLLTDNGIRYVGTGKNLQDAWQPATITANGIKICFAAASYASVNDNGKTVNNYVARIEDSENLKSQIQNLKSSCDFIVAAMHAGVEYTRAPNKSQTDFAHAAIDAGADLVIGGHPHWVQTMEQYNGKYIFYSLGNFIFDQEWSQDTKEGLALKITVSKNVVQAPGLPDYAGQGPALHSQSAPAVPAAIDDLQGSRLPAKLKSIELIPIIIENYSTPRPATAEEAKQILEKIGVTDTVIKP